MTKPIYLPETLPAYPGRDGTRQGAQRAAAAAIAASVAAHGKGATEPAKEKKRKAVKA